ncbi:MAG TPA: PadR family transcriptional regulator [Acidimicrobiales bacterium]|nr:PadR family transcriptional regulator [Acidimicrobiales bacterium]
MTDPLVDLGRYSGPATLVLSSLAGGDKHGYALARDVEDFSGVTLGPGTLYGALARLEEAGMVEPLPSEDRRRPYRITAAGARALEAQLRAQRQVAEVGLHRLALGGAGG